MVTDIAMAFGAAAKADMVTAMVTDMARDMAREIDERNVDVVKGIKQINRKK